MKNDRQKNYCLQYISAKVPLFRFGENWERYSEQILNEQRLAVAEQSLVELVGKNAVAGKSFIDIGCGSGLFSVAAARLGATPVIGIDVDKICVRVADQNACEWLPEEQRPTYQQLSVLNRDELRRLGVFDIVYAWGSLHHTGAMYTAIENAVSLVNEQGMFVIAIYNRHCSSPVWVGVKWFYNQLPRFLQPLLCWFFVPIILTAKLIATRKNPFQTRRGMDFFVDVTDWVGGYPYEYASVEEIAGFVQPLGFVLEKFTRGATPIACNEFVFRKVQETR